MKNKKFKIGVVTSALVAQAILPIAALAETTTSSEEINSEEINVDLNIVQEKNADIVLTVGNSAVNGANFKSDVVAALEARGVDPSRVNVQSIETKAQNLQTSFNWNQHVSSSVGSIAIQENGTKLQMYGNPKNAGFNKIFTDNNQDLSIREQSMKFDFTLNYGDSFDGAGVLINTHVENDLMYGYALFFPKSGNNSVLYKLNGLNSSNSHNIASSSSATKIGTFATGKEGSFELKTTKNSVAIYKSGVLVDSVALPTHYGWGVGFFSDHYSHNCNLIGQFALENISLSQTNAKDFKELIRQPEWQENTERFVVNLEDYLVSGLENPSDSGEILTRLINEDIHYVGLGTSTNKEQAENFIQRNNGNGLFVDNTDYDNSIESIADYVVEKLNATATVVSEDNPYFLTGTPLIVQTNPASLSKNTQTEEYTNGRWKITHDENFFENSEGQYALSGVFQKDIPTVFNQPGRYELSFANTAPSPQFIYGHRSPVAAFDLTYAKTEEGVTVTTTDKSFDPDYQTAENKGIVEHKWRWKETMDVTWNEGQLPANLPEGKNYILELQVKDEQGVWSLPVSTYVTTDVTVETTPIANFTSVDELDISEPFEINDSSYDPSGKELTSKTWTVLKNGRTVYKGDTPVANFEQYGIGTYKVSLVVTNSSGKSSSAYTRTVNVAEKAYAEVVEGLNKISEDIKVVDFASLDNLKSDLNDLTNKVNELKDATNRTNANTELDKLRKQLEAAEKIIDLEEQIKIGFNSQAKIDAAKVKYEEALQTVNALPAHANKDALLARLQKVLEALEKAEDELLIVEISPGSNGADLEWQPYDFEALGFETDYKIVVRQLDKDTGEVTKITFDRTAKTTDIDIQGLIPGEKYLFEVYPRKNGVVITEEPIASTIVDIPLPEEPAVPTVQNIVATSVDATTATITWDAFEGAKRYRVQYYVQDPLTGEFVKEGYGRTTTVPSLTINTLSEGRTYKFDVTPYVTKFDDANKGYSNVIDLAVPQVEVEEEEPTVVEDRLQVELVNETTANLSWEKQEGEQDRYRMQLYAKNSSGLFETVGTARAITETTFVYTNLTPGTEYKFEVVPRVGYVYDTTKAFSKTLVVPTVEKPEESTPPTTTTTDGDGGNEVENNDSNSLGVQNIVANMQGRTSTITWDSLSVNGKVITTYRVQRYVKDNLTGQYKLELTRTASGTSYLDTYKLTSGKTYKYEIIPRVGFKYDEEYKGTKEVVNP